MHRWTQKIKIIVGIQSYHPDVLICKCSSIFVKDGGNWQIVNAIVHELSRKNRHINSDRFSWFSMVIILQMWRSFCLLYNMSLRKGNHGEWDTREVCSSNQNDYDRLTTWLFCCHSLCKNYCMWIPICYLQLCPPWSLITYEVFIFLLFPNLPKNRKDKYFIYYVYTIMIIISRMFYKQQDIDFRQ